MARKPKFKVGDEVRTSEGWTGVVKEVTNNSDRGAGVWYRLLNEKDHRDTGDAEPLHGSVWVQASKLSYADETDADVSAGKGRQGTDENEPDDDETHDQLTEKFAQAATKHGYREGPGVAFHPLDQSRQSPGDFTQPKGPGKVNGDEPSNLLKDKQHEKAHFDHANLAKKIPTQDQQYVNTDMFGGPATVVKPTKTEEEDENDGMDHHEYTVEKVADQAPPEPVAPSDAPPVWAPDKTKDRPVYSPTKEPEKPENPPVNTSANVPNETTNLNKK